jgi:cephalosporin hydroxylase
LKGNVLNKPRTYDQQVPNAQEFQALRDEWKEKLASDQGIRDQAIQLIIEGNKYNFGYQWEWCGVPIIRHPDDIVLQQEIMWSLKPSRVIETGVARGGSLVLSASLMKMTGMTPRVLGLDIQILPHATNSIASWIKDGSVELLECDSSSDSAIHRAETFLEDASGPCLLILDSNHSHEHVYRELSALAPLLPLGSIVIVADTIVEEMPENYYPNRPWGKGNNPRTAITQFLKEKSNFSLDNRWSRRSLLGECRDGILIRSF